MEWLTTHAAELSRYQGEWLLIVGSELVAPGKDFNEIRQVIEARQIYDLFLYCVSIPEEADFIFKGFELWHIKSTMMWKYPIALCQTSQGCLLLLRSGCTTQVIQQEQWASLILDRPSRCLKTGWPDKLGIADIIVGRITRIRKAGGPFDIYVFDMEAEIFPVHFHGNYQDK